MYLDLIFGITLYARFAREGGSLDWLLYYIIVFTSGNGHFIGLLLWREFTHTFYETYNTIFDRHYIIVFESGGHEVVTLSDHKRNCIVAILFELFSFRRKLFFGLMRRTVIQGFWGGHYGYLATFYTVTTLVPHAPPFFFMTLTRDLFWDLFWDLLWDLFWYLFWYLFWDLLDILYIIYILFFGGGYLAELYPTTSGIVLNCFCGSLETFYILLLLVFGIYWDFFWKLFLSKISF